MRFVLLGCLLTTLIGASPHKARAIDCPPVRLDSPGGSMEHVPAMEQGPGICGSYAASQFYDALRFTNGDLDVNFHTSPIEPAVEGYIEKVTSGLYTKKSYTYNFEAGFICDAFNAIVKKGACDAETTHYLESTRAFANVYFHPYIVRGGEERDVTTPWFGTPVIPAADQRFSEFITKSCDSRPRKFYNPGRCEEKYFSTETTVDEKRRFIDRTLKTKTSAPVPISFCSSFLTGGAKIPNNESASPNCKPHATLIIGRRQVGERCQYLVRNSWGTGHCQNYKGRFQEGCEDNGNIWVDAGKLTRRIYLISTLKKRQ